MSNDGVIAVERALSVLDCFSPQRPSLSLAELAALSPLHKTTIFRLLNSLMRAGYVVRNQEGIYSLGPRVLYLGRVYERGFKLAEVVMPVLTSLMQETGESASYYTPQKDGSRLCLFRSQPYEGLHSQVLAGSVMPPDQSSTGRVFKIWDQLAKRGKDPLPFFSSGVRDPYSASWSIPIFGNEDRFVAALTLAGLAARIHTLDAPRMTLLLRNAARDLSERLGASREALALIYEG